MVVLRYVPTFKWIYGEKPTLKLDDNMVIPPSDTPQVYDQSGPAVQRAVPSSADPNFYGCDLWGPELENAGEFRNVTH